MDIALGVAVGGVLILFSLTLRAGMGAAWLNRLGAKLRRPDAPDVPGATAIDAMGEATVPLATVLRAAGISPVAAPAPEFLPPPRPALPPRRASRDQRAARSRAAGPASAVRQPLRPAEHDKLCALLEACSIVPAQGEVEPVAPAAAPSPMVAETIVHIPEDRAPASGPMTPVAENHQAEDESRRAVEEVSAIAAAQLRRRLEEVLRVAPGADAEAKGRTRKDPSPATREVTRIADELAQHWAVEAVNRTAEKARIDTEARRAASPSIAPTATGFGTTGVAPVDPAWDHTLPTARSAGRERRVVERRQRAE
jgi:hypothetical protein